MGSQETLINPTPLALKFNRKSSTNATIYSGSHPVYRITTNKDKTRTDVIDLAGAAQPISENGTLAATIKRREFFPDVVKLRSRPEGIKISKWLQKEKLSDGIGMIVDTSSGPLLWKYGMEAARYRLALYTDKEADRPVAYLDCSRTRIPMVLVIEPGYQDITEEILTSALILEYKMKMFERIRKNDVLYGPILGALALKKPTNPS